MSKNHLSRREVLKTAGAITASAAGANLAVGEEQTSSLPSQERATLAAPPLTPEQQALEKLWEEHLASEFQTKSAEAAVNTMVARPSVNHIPVMTGGVGRRQLEHFYGTYFIPHMPPDAQIIPISRTIGRDRLVDEFVFKFTHSLQMDWLLPGVPATNKPVEVVKVVVVEFRDGKIAGERIHWDQASVLVQLGLLDADKLPVAGVAAARKVLDPDLPSNELMKRTIADDLL
jgi:carboxymethylenebutenolidase